MFNGRSILALILFVGLSFGAINAEHHEEGEMHEMEMGAPKQMKEAEYLVGTWDVDMQWRDMKDPEQWNSSKNSASYKYILNGCALESTFKGEMMGMPFDGFMLISYDRDTDEWQNLWIDSMGGKMSFYKGKEEDDKLILSGEETWGGQTFISRTVIFNRTNTRFEWTMDHSYDGGNTWQTVGKAVYTKK